MCLWAVAKVVSLHFIPKTTLFIIYSVALYMLTQTEKITLLLIRWPHRNLTAWISWRNEVLAGMEDIRWRDCCEIIIEHFQDRVFPALLGMVELNLRSIWIELLRSNGWQHYSMHVHILCDPSPYSQWQKHDHFVGPTWLWTETTNGLCDCNAYQCINTYIKKHSFMVKYRDLL